MKKTLLSSLIILSTSLNAEYLMKHQIQKGISNAFNVEEASYFVFNKNEPSVTRDDERIWNSPSYQQYIDTSIEGNNVKAFRLTAYPNYDTDRTDRQGGNARYRFELPQGLKFNTMHYDVVSGCASGGSGYYAFVALKRNESNAVYKWFASNQSSIGWATESFSEINPLSSDVFHLEVETYQYPHNFAICIVDVLLEYKVN